MSFKQMLIKFYVSSASWFNKMIRFTLKIMNSRFFKIAVGVYIAILWYEAMDRVVDTVHAADGLITIDAGHGGSNSTPGKRAANGDFYEWDINDKVADKVEELLEAKGYTVERLDDVTGQTDVSLNTRLRKAKELGSELHISIHENALDDIMWSNATGTETYYSILGSEKSQQLAKDVANRMAQYIGAANRGAKGTNGELFINREFTKAGIDNILVEGLFMDNEKDVQYMQTQEYVDRYAQAVVDGITNTYGEEIK